MKKIAKMNAEELAGVICQSLMDAGVTVTLTGGACVTIWSKGKYTSCDLDFIEEGPVPRRKIQAVLGLLGFERKGRHFIHPETSFFVEFPTGPLMVGNQNFPKDDLRLSKKNSEARIQHPASQHGREVPRRGGGNLGGENSRPRNQGVQPNQ